MSARRVAVIGAVVLALVGIVTLFVVRPPTTVASALDPDVTIVCAAATGMDVNGCRAWGDDVIGAGAPSFTFELGDVTRLAFDRSAFGFGSSCEVSYFIGRFADPAWAQETPCLGS